MRRVEIQDVLDEFVLPHDSLNLVPAAGMLGQKPLRHHVHCRLEDKLHHRGRYAVGTQLTELSFVNALHSFDCGVKDLLCLQGLVLSSVAASHKFLSQLNEALLKHGTRSLLLFKRCLLFSKCG